MAINPIYRLKRDNNGKLSIYLQNYNVKVAVFAKGVPQSEMKEILNKINS